MKGLPLGPSIWNGFAGAVIADTAPRDLQSLLPSTIETYNKWVASHNATHTVDILAADNSTRLLWIGSRKAQSVILFFHGMMLHSQSRALLTH